LADIVECHDKEELRDILVTFNPKRALKEITSGLRHLHALKLVHRDIKPQNILISSTRSSGGRNGGYRMLISDFGLCKKLDLDQTSFMPTAYGAMAAGTVGWRAPEILRGDVKLDVLSDDQSISSSRGSTGTVSGATPTPKQPKLTKAVDIFALGCLFYYTLTNGTHPFGDRYEREVNILKSAKNLDGLESLGEEGSEAVDLIRQMLDPEASQRYFSVVTLTFTSI
jgi:serine/threonine-protein kinase/endoribonuclease IRE1